MSNGWTGRVEVQGVCAVYAYLPDISFVALHVRVYVFADLVSKTWCVGVGAWDESTWTVFSDNALLKSIVLQFLWEECILHSSWPTTSLVSCSHHHAMQKEGLSQTSAWHLLSEFLWEYGSSRDDKWVWICVCFSVCLWSACHYCHTFVHVLVFFDTQNVQNFNDNSLVHLCSAGSMSHRQNWWSFLLFLCSNWKRSLSCMTLMTRWPVSQKFGRGTLFCMMRKQEMLDSLKISRVQDHSSSSVTRIWDMSWLWLLKKCGNVMWSMLMGWPKGWHSWRRTLRMVQQCALFLLCTNSEFSDGSGLTRRTLMLMWCRMCCWMGTWNVRCLWKWTNWNVQNRILLICEMHCAKWGNCMRSVNWRSWVWKLDKSVRRNWSLLMTVQCWVSLKMCPLLCVLHRFVHTCSLPEIQLSIMLSTVLFSSQQVLPCRQVERLWKVCANVAMSCCPLSNHLVKLPTKQGRLCVMHKMLKHHTLMQLQVWLCVAQLTVMVTNLSTISFWAMLVFCDICQSLTQVFAMLYKLHSCMQLSMMLFVTLLLPSVFRVQSFAKSKLLQT